MVFIVTCSVAEIKAAFESSALRVHRVYRRQEYLFHALVGNLFCVIRVWRNGAHAAGVETFVVVERALVIHRRYHGDYGLAVREREHRHLGTRQKFFDNDAVSALAEFLVAHDFNDRFFCFVARCGDYNALAERETVRLYNGRNGC